MVSARGNLRLSGFWGLERYEIDTVRNTLRVDDRVITSRGQVVRLIAYLFRNPNRLIKRSELLRELWPDQTGSAGALNFCVAKAREVLAELPNGHLRTLRGHGYWFEIAGEAPHQTSLQNTSTQTAPVRSWSAPKPKPLFGRKAELQTLLCQWDTVERWHQPRLMVIRGAAGVGKTRLVEAFAERLDKSGKRCVWAACPDSNGLPPLWPWPDVLEGLFCHEAAPASKPIDLYSRVDQHRFMRRLRREVWRASRQEPLALVLDNMHVADRDAFTVLRQLFSSERGLGLLGIVIVRDGHSPAVADTLVKIRSYSRELRVCPLTVDAGRALLRWSYKEISPEAEREALQVGAGSPLLLSRLGEAIRANAGTESDVDYSKLFKRNITQVLTLRVGMLPEATRALLVVAALVGDEFGTVTLAAACNETVERVLSALQPAVDAEIVQRAAPMTFRFEHPLFRESLQGELEQDARRRLHWCVGEALQLTAELHRSAAVRVAHHLCRGTRTQYQAALAVSACQAAAEASLTSCSFELAARLYTDALSLSDLAAIGVRHKLQLLAGLGRSLALAGKVFASREATSDAVKLAVTHAISGEERAAVALAFSQTHNASVGNQPAIVSALSDTLMSGGLSATTECRLICRLAKVSHPRPLPPVIAPRHAELRRQVSLDSGLPYLQLAQSYNDIYVLARAEQLSGLLEEAHRGLAERGDHEYLAEVGVVARGLAIQRGDARGAERFRRRGLEWNVSVEDQMAYLSLLTDTALAVFRGDPRAPTMVGAAQELGMKVAPETAVEAGATQAFLNSLESGVGLEVAAPDSPFVAAASKSPMGRVLAAFGLAACGHETAASELYLLANVDPTICEWWPSGLLALFVELAAHHGDHARAETVLATHAAYSEHLGIMGTVATILSPMGFALGAAAASLGRTGEAKQHFQAARDICFEFGAAGWVFRCEHALAELDRLPAVGGRWRLRRQAVTRGPAS